MNGCTIPYTPIAVDLWKVRQCQRVRLFFLSHVHLDQTCGLSSSWSMPIYCSPLSKKLLLQRFSLNPDVVHDLELNVPHIIPLTSNEDVTMTVTLIDANHCPGSVMFFFEGYFGRILYTGDFRYTENMMTTSPFCDIISKPIDSLYMDNTYCSPKCVFPTRDVAQREILMIIDQHPKEKIVIGLRNLGKEDLLIAIASHFGMTIKVSEERYKTLELLDAHEQFSVVDNSCRIEVVPMMQVTQQNMEAWNIERPTIAILPTAIFTALGFLPFHGQRDTFVVPYSDHCSYTELHRFVAAVKPKSVIPIVKGGVRDPLTSSLLDRTSVECFLEYYDKTPMTNYHIPMAVLELMNQTPSRSGSSRRSGALQKADSRMKSQRPNARNKKRIETKPNVSRTACNTALVPLEPKTIDTDRSKSSPSEPKTIDTDRSKSSPSEHPRSEPRGNMLSNKRSFDELRCSPAAKTNSLSTAVKPNSLGSKLIRCASSDRLFSSCFRPHVKLRATRVASPDLRVQMKRKAGADVKRFCAAAHSNLIRTRRVRLCSAHVCRTLCHGSENCHAVSNASYNGSTVVPSETVLEVNRGEETMFRFTDDVLHKLRSPAQVTTEFQDTNSTSSGTNQSREDRQLNENRSQCSFSALSSCASPTYACHSPTYACHSPTYACHSPTAQDMSNGHLNSLSENARAAASELTSVMELRSKGLVMSGFPPQCLIVTPSAPQVPRRSDFLQGENHNRVNSLSDYIFSPVERNLLADAEPSFPALSLPMQASSADIPSFPMQVSSASIPLAVMDQYPNFHHAVAASMFHLQPGRNRMISDLSQPPSWNPVSSLVYSVKNSADVTVLTSQGQSVERMPKRLCLGHGATTFLDQPVGNSSRSPVHSLGTSGASGEFPARDGSPVLETVELSRESHVVLCNADKRSSSLVATSEPHKRVFQHGSDDGSNPVDAANLANPVAGNELNSEMRKGERLCNIGGKMVLHTTNPVLEDKLPPKKNWRHRFGLAQLHKSYQENKWIDPNGVSKLLVANGTAGNSRT